METSKPYPEPDFVVDRKGYYSSGLMVQHAREASGFQQVFNYHLPEPVVKINHHSYYASYQLQEVTGRATVMAELTKDLPPLPDNAVNLDTARYGRLCYEQAVRDEIEKRKTVIDLNELSMKGLHDVYVAKFGPLPERIMMNDILWHIHQLIKEAPIKEE